MQFCVIGKKKHCLPSPKSYLNSQRRSLMVNKVLKAVFLNPSRSFKGCHHSHPSLSAMKLLLAPVFWFCNRVHKFCLEVFCCYSDVYQRELPTDSDSYTRKLWCQKSQSFYDIAKTEGHYLQDYNQIFLGEDYFTSCTRWKFTRRKTVCVSVSRAAAISVYLCQSDTLAHFTNFSSTTVQENQDFTFLSPPHCAASRLLPNEAHTYWSLPLFTWLSLFAWAKTKNLWWIMILKMFGISRQDKDWLKTAGTDFL